MSFIKLYIVLWRWNIDAVCSGLTGKTKTYFIKKQEKSHSFHFVLFANANVCLFNSLENNKMPKNCCLTQSPPKRKR